MDQTEIQNLQSLPRYMTFPYIKRVTQFLLSVSVFSFLFSYSLWHFCFFLHPFKFYFSSFPMRLLSHSLDKNVIFLICNGILVFLAKTSCFVRSTSAFDVKEMLLKKIEGSLQMEPETNDSLLEKEVFVESPVPFENAIFEKQVMEEQEEEQRKEEEEVEVKKELIEEEREDLKLIVYEEKEGREREEEEAEEYEVVEENGLLSTEELNKKFDEFIRKMKEELRIEAQQQLIMV